MFEQYFLSVTERLYGEKLPALVSRAGTISERTLRNWLGGIIKPDQHKLDKLARRNMQWMRGHIAQNEWSEDDREAYMAGLDANTGTVSQLIFAMHWQCGKAFPVTLSLARQIDTLSAAMAECRMGGDLPGFVQQFNTNWLSDCHFHNPESALTPPLLRVEGMQASEWPALAMPTAVLLLNLQLQLLATLDHEFGAHYLPTFRPIPVFHGLIPTKVASHGSASRRRGEIRLPVRRLLDMLACMRYYRIHNRWPAAIPSVNDCAAWMNVLPRDLAKWRLGRAFTMRDFDQAWHQMFKDIPEQRRPGTPTPLLFTTVMLTKMLVQGSREQHNLSVAWGGSAPYLAWWERQRDIVEASLDKPRAGTEAWMPGLL